MTLTVLAAHAWRNNAELIRDVAALGYITGSVLDCTYGEGKFWTLCRPDRLFATDLDPAKAPDGVYDFTALPGDWTARFDTVVFDPPYKLNGTPDRIIDERYGVHEVTNWRDRLSLMSDGLHECARVTKVGGTVLVKCQDQVVSGAIRWQTDLMTEIGFERGLDKIDRFDLLGKHRPQPMEGRTQQHAHGRPSTLLVFRKAGF